MKFEKYDKMFNSRLNAGGKFDMYEEKRKVLFIIIQCVVDVLILILS